eukprot:TRINITY_DN4935_c1_g3_i1.p1 TRINITY_DN4935_c1_g3~~TRINITY_DN4935_c1_g3_i1.p1  ORF type:complete len:227 (+),score=29.13 TRINITY_DN4935_c1_g3_i1:85-765(+)
MVNFFDDDMVCAGKLCVWTMSFEEDASVAKLRRCSIEPSACVAADGPSKLHGVTRHDTLDVSPRDASRLRTMRIAETLHATNMPMFVSVKVAASPDLAHGEVFDELLPGDTTIMARDIPCKVGYERMMVELERLGLDGCYDFIYFPKSLRDRNSNRGFCFINFMNSAAVGVFVAKFRNFQFEGIKSQKAVRIGRANTQGRIANVVQLQAVRNRVLFKADPVGVRVS